MFAELLAKSNYSFLEGASSPQDMVTRAQLLGYSAVGITDINGVYGAARAMLASERSQIHLIVGAQLTLKTQDTIFLLARNSTGYSSLCELLTLLHKDTDLTIQLDRVLERAAELLILLPVRNSRESTIQSCLHCFSKQTYLVHSCFYDGSDRYFLEKTERWSSTFRIPVTVSQEPLFHIPDYKPLHDVLRCIRHRTTLEGAGFTLLQNNMRHLKPIAEIERAYLAHPTWIESTHQIAQQCTFSLRQISYRYPTEWIPKMHSSHSYLCELVRTSADEKYSAKVPKPVAKQIEHELSMIEKLKYTDYFLTIWDIVRFARSKNILCQGRGSAANSIVCFVLGITAIDPVRMDLLFERFISVERQEPPDIDIDFEHERREEVIQYIYERYGRTRAALTATVICFRKKSALKQVGIVFGIAQNDIDRLLSALHRKPSDSLTIELCQSVGLQTDRQRLVLFLDIVHKIVGTPRHLATHVGGFVLCQDSLDRTVPVQSAAMPGRTIIQWDKNDLDALGFVRVDILGLGILTCITKCLKLVKHHYGLDYSLETIPAEDTQVYDAMCRSDTVGVFQIESRAQINMLGRLKPRCFSDIVAEISLVRPGPVQAQMVHPYLRRRAGLEKIEYPHPDLKPILQKTYGVPLFQEQVMKIAMRVAGLTPGQADQLRRAMASWRSDAGKPLAEIGAHFRQGLIKHGIEESYADRIYTQVEGFAQYGFPESHAASFAILTYATMYLKNYFPDAYLTALLNSQPMGFYSKHSLIDDAKRHGVMVLPIDLLRSSWDNTIESKGNVRLGFREVRGLKRAVASAIESLRAERPFRSFEDFTQRLQSIPSTTALTRRDLFLLAAAHAFSSIGLSRRAAMWKISGLHLSGTTDLTAADNAQADLPIEADMESILLDYNAQGVCLTSHPVEILRKQFKCRPTTSSDQLAKQRHRSRVRTMGLIICRQMPPTAKGTMFITLEDEHGFINLIVRNHIFERNRATLLHSSFLYAEGVVECAVQDQPTQIIADTFVEVPVAPYV